MPKYLSISKTAKIDYFTKNLSIPMFLDINTSNFQKMFLVLLKKIYWKEFKKIYITKKKCFFLFIIFINFFHLFLKNSLQHNF